MVFANAPVDNANLCGTIDYQAFWMVPDAEGNLVKTPVPASGGDPLSYNPATLEWTADTDDISLLDYNFGIYPIMVDATLTSYKQANYPTVTTATKATTIDFNDACLDPFDFNTNSINQQNATPNKYTGTLISVPVSLYAIEPPQCAIVYSCAGVTRVDGQPSQISCADFVVDENAGVWDFSITANDSKYTGLVWDPAVYSVTILGTAVRSGETLTSNFQLELVDPCNPPNSITAPTLLDQNYIITTPAASYVHEAFSVDPAYCPLEYANSVTLLANGNNAVTEGATNSRTFSFYYDSDLTPADETEEIQTITVTASSKSLYTYPAGELNSISASDSFDLSFDSPCSHADLVTITSTSQTQPSNAAIVDGSAVVFTYNPFTVSPSFCPLQVTCANVAGPSGNTASCPAIDPSTG